MPFITALPIFSRHATSLVGIGVILLLSGNLTSQTKAPETDLRALRASFRQNLLTAIIPEKRNYALQLQELEKKFAGARDYASALKVRDERLALEQELTAFAQELPGLAARAAGHAALLPERIQLRPQDSSMTGVKLDKEASLSGWSSPQCAATWKLPSLPAGGYEVILKYACGGETSIAFDVHEAFYTLRGKIPATGGKLSETNLGTLRIRDGTGPLTLAMDGGSQSATLRVVELELAPVNR